MIGVCFRNTRKKFSSYRGEKNFWKFIKIKFSQRIRYEKDDMNGPAKDSTFNKGYFSRTAGILGCFLLFLIFTTFNISFENKVEINRSNNFSLDRWYRTEKFKLLTTQLTFCSSKELTGKSGDFPNIVRNSKWP